LGYYNLAGEMTIDTYYLSLLLDYGPLGLASFILLLSSVVWLGFKLFRDAETEEQELAAPLALGVLNILIVKSVSSVEMNLPIAFMMSGLIVGLAWQHAKAKAPNAALDDAGRERLPMSPGPAVPA
jgi:O-antigen ligase